MEGREPLASLRKAKPAGAKILELRIDRFPVSSESLLLRKIQSYRSLRLPLIATIRSRREGGGRVYSETKRLEIFRKILSLVEAIDIELTSKTLVKILIPLAHRKGKKVIVSYHNFRSTPSDGALQKLIKKGKRVGGDLVKIAVMPRKVGDVGRLLLFTRRNRHENLISIAMGPKGRATRLLVPAFGSLLTYSFVGRPQAPGQIPIEKLVETGFF